MSKDFIESLYESGNDLLKAEAISVNLLKNTKKTKSGLEDLLSASVSEIVFYDIKTKKWKTAICTSNNRLIKAYMAKNAKEMLTAIHTRNIGIKTNDKNSVLTFDLIGKHYKPIPLDSWYVHNCIALTEQNILVLNESLKNCLKKS